MTEFIRMIKDFSILYLLIVVVSQLLSETQLNRYLRFFAGVIFVIMICSPGYKKITGKDVIEGLEHEYTRLEFLQQLEYEKSGVSEWKEGNEYAVNILINVYNETISSLGYEIVQYECKKELDGGIKYLWLYVDRNHGINRRLRDYREEDEGARQCKKLIMKKWKMEFELRVYGRKG